MIFSIDNCGKTSELACQLCCPLIRFSLQPSQGCCASRTQLHQCISLATVALWGPCAAEDCPVRDFACFSANDFGLFLSDEDPKKGIWLEAGKALDYYMLRNGVSIHPTSFQLHPLLCDLARSVEVVWVSAVLLCIVPCSTPCDLHNCAPGRGELLA